MLSRLVFGRRFVRTTHCWAICLSQSRSWILVCCSSLCNYGHFHVLIFGMTSTENVLIRDQHDFILGRISDGCVLWLQVRGATHRRQLDQKIQSVLHHQDVQLGWSFLFVRRVMCGNGFRLLQKPRYHSVDFHGDHRTIIRQFNSLYYVQRK